MLRNYLSEETEPKLHLGAGWHRLEGWLNADLDIIPGVLTMDVRKPFRLPSSRFQFAFTEHMIEHITYGEGLLMLRECNRVLREGGVLRVTTPDLRFLVDLCRNPQKDIHQRYITWMCRTYVPYAPVASAAFAINEFMRLWGHKFIYDENTLRESLSRSGFSAIRRCKLMESSWPVLRDIECGDREPEGFIELESMALEATK
jgi:predicted SAM-dependent methyltransferase